MGWPRNADIGLYAEKKKDPAYLLVFFCNQNYKGDYDCIANVHEGSRPSLCGTGCSPQYLHNKCRRAEWEELPEVWQQSFTRYMNSDPDQPFDPVKERGLHKVKKCVTLP